MTTILLMVILLLLLGGGGWGWRTGYFGGPNGWPVATLGVVLFWVIVFWLIAELVTPFHFSFR